MKEFLKLVVYLCNNCNKEIYRTKLNKLLFYTQFSYYKEYKERLLEDDFQYDYFGPVLPDLDKKLEKLKEANLINLVSDGFGTIIESNVRIDNDLYTDKEIAILDKVIRNFDSCTSKQISGYSHNEVFWSYEKKGQVIEIDNAYKLRKFRK